MACSFGLDRSIQKYDTPVKNAEQELQPSSITSLAICFYGFYKVLSAWWDLSSLNVNQYNNSGASLLYLSALGSYLPICRRLIELDANVNAQGGDYGNTLQAASCEGHENIVELLLSKGADINAQGGLFGHRS